MRMSRAEFGGVTAGFDGRLVTGPWDGAAVGHDVARGGEGTRGDASGHAGRVGGARDLRHERLVGGGGVVCEAMISLDTLGVNAVMGLGQRRGDSLDGGAVASHRYSLERAGGDAVHRAGGVRGAVERLLGMAEQTV